MLRIDKWRQPNGPRFILSTAHAPRCRCDRYELDSTVWKFEIRTAPAAESGSTAEETCVFLNADASRSASGGESRTGETHYTCDAVNCMYDGSVLHAFSGYKFTGKERDTESGLDNFGARYKATRWAFMAPYPKVLFSDKSDILNDAWSHEYVSIDFADCVRVSTVDPQDEWKLMCFEFLRLG